MPTTADRRSGKVHGDNERHTGIRQAGEELLEALFADTHDCLSLFATLDDHPDSVEKALCPPAPNAAIPE
jgi:hypothetical protein